MTYSVSGGVLNSTHSLNYCICNHTSVTSADLKTINLLKTVELVFCKPSTTHDILPTELADVQKASSAKLLGVVIRQDINFCQHTESVITTRNQRLSLLAQLRRQNLSVTATDNIFQAIILNKIMYALPVYFGYRTDRQKHQLQQMWQSQAQVSLTLHDYNIEILAEEAEYNLFHNSCSENHCLHHIYTVNEKPGTLRLRTRGHNFTLPFVKYNFNKKNFIVRALSNYI